ncbi:hypothetical protein OHU11_20760 [Streptomyces sp. NBC_00257]|uniref:hypothetical protein n=1 Tax=unclassified Streptomyces TaxID=2593676 RepID=UPI002259E6AB|nr:MULTISPECIES: hypothetical protein [unclassified Streptomyces]WTB55744.1 hypothetical protein OG832_22610 [Streptomyces sp. NBC_00826]WTH91373.1 hypothetical protein OIC43_21085 [Streptomyces sp. NBC_00825]WTI00101.1 hypothetical protein OHA23_21070 [Streptomyces sp. NBC_00822]MCX4865586.1 hypothetical protein [Streptomyces sp. NBC_00906]MCX4896824.1 hypothetical protein [Streptomyces sp. NBC_00892]
MAEARVNTERTAVRRRSAWLAALSAGALAATLLVSGCDGEPARPPSAPGPVATPTPTTTANLRLPLNAYLPTPEEQATGEYLVYRVQQRCMRGFGFQYLPHLSSDYIKTTVATWREYESRRYGISERAIAAERGYHLDKAPGGTRAPQIATALSLPEREALSGRTADGRASSTPLRGRPVPRDGCAGQAVRTVHADGSESAQRGNDLVARLRHEAFERSRSDPRVAAVNRTWSSCMRDKGFTYRDPDAALEDPRWDLRSARPSRAEIAVATADISCKLRVNLLGTNFAVEAEYENAVIKDHTPELEKARTRKAAESERLPGLMRRYDRAPSPL